MQEEFKNKDGRIVSDCFSVISEAAAQRRRRRGLSAVITDIRVVLQEALICRAAL